MNGLAYLAALAILVINDHVLEALAPGAITGKLSDFAGLFAFAVFLCVAIAALSLVAFIRECK